jgi:hypothetical protein
MESVALLESRVFLEEATYGWDGWSSGDAGVHVGDVEGDEDVPVGYGMF